MRSDDAGQHRVGTRARPDQDDGRASGTVGLQLVLGEAGERDQAAVIGSEPGSLCDEGTRRILVARGSVRLQTMHCDGVGMHQRAITSARPSAPLRMIGAL
jgi:hypothetical protein